MTATTPTRRLPEGADRKAVGLFLDVDGTLLDIAPRPELVEVAADLLHDLDAAHAALDGALALVSGRPIAELDRLFAPLRLPASGVHGAELRHQPNSAVVKAAARQLSDEAWAALDRMLGEFSGSYAENKGVSFAIHYPLPGTDIARLEDAVRSLMRRVETPDQLLHLLAGHAVFEMQLRGFDKGQAIRRFMEQPPFVGRRPVFIGDDEIDRAGFETALRLGGFAYSVGIVVPGLSGRFANPQEVRAWLHELSR
jgi:trehalose 6-phosphate phosphatase